MSTILDALRKVEEERRASGHSPREQILFFPQVPLSPSPSRKGVWVISLVLMGVGFAGGVGMTLFRSGLTAPGPGAPPAPIAPALAKQPSAQPTSSPSDPPAAVAAASRLPKKFPSSPAPVPRFPSGESQEFSLGGFPAAVQRSPFAVSKEQYKSEQENGRRQTADGGQRSESSLQSKQLREASVSERSERSLPSKQPYEQPQDTLEPQVPSPSSSPGIPKVSLNLLQWSPEAERRLAFISVNGGPMLMVHEGDTVSDLTVERILADAVELRFGDSTFVVKPHTRSSSPAPLAP